MTAKLNLGPHIPAFAVASYRRGLPMAAIAREIGCSASRVRQILVVALDATERCALRVRKDVKERFMEKVDMSGECWIWVGKINSKTGYGVFKLLGRDRSTSRLAYELFNGEEPGDLFVCHHCDVPSCVNPAHLFLGTPTDNMVDMSKKKRAGDPWRGRARGGFGRGDLNQEVADAVRVQLAAGCRHEDVAKEFLISVGTISNIATGKRWVREEVQA